MASKLSDLLETTYSVEDIDEVLLKSGLKAGDVCIVHFSLFALGFLQCKNNVKPQQIWIDALQRATGPNGCIILPAFTYSYGNHKVFDPLKSKSSVNCLANYCIHTHQGFRTQDPMFSYVILPNSDAVAAKVVDYKFSNVCFDIEGGIVGLARSLNPEPKYIDIYSTQSVAHFTFCHSVDQQSAASTRFMKQFHGKTIVDGHAQDRECFYFCRVISVPNTINGSSVNDYDQKLVHRLGSGLIFCDYVNHLMEIYGQNISNNPWHYMKGPALSHETMLQLISAERDVVEPTQIKRSYYPIIKL